MPPPVFGLESRVRLELGFEGLQRRLRRLADTGLVEAVQGQGFAVLPDYLHLRPPKLREPDKVTDAKEGFVF